MNDQHWCIGCDRIAPLAAMRWIKGEWTCSICCGSADRLPGPDWKYKTGVDMLGKSWHAYVPPKGSPERAIFLPMEQP